MAKRFISVLIMLAVMATFIPASTVSAGATEANTIVEDTTWYKDTEENLYIENEADFLGYAKILTDTATNTNVATFENQVIHIMNDLDMTGIDWYEEILYNKEVSAIIDGHGHTIKGLEYSNIGGSNQNHSGLLGGKLVASGAVNDKYNASAGVFNLTIYGTINNEHNYTGALFGSITPTDNPIVIENVFVGVDIGMNDTNSSKGMIFGGFIGANQHSNVTISNCLAKVSITVDASIKAIIGGFCGQNGVSKNDTAALTIENSVFNGNLKASNGSIGSLLGLIGNDKSNLTVYNNICTGTIGEANTALDNICASDLNLDEKNKLYFEMNSNSIPIGFAMRDSMTVPVGIYNLTHQRHLQADETKVSTTYVGYQLAKVNEKSYDIRLSAVLNDGNSGDKTLNSFSGVGFEICMRREGSNAEWDNKDANAIHTVYTSMLDGNESKSAEQLGGDYIFLATVKGLLVEKGSVELTVKTFHCGDSSERLYDDTYIIVIDTNALANGGN